MREKNLGGGKRDGKEETEKMQGVLREWKESSIFAGGKGKT